jgi:hypothetical protein
MHLSLSFTVILQLTSMSIPRFYPLLGIEMESLEERRRSGPYFYVLS